MQARDREAPQSGALEQMRSVLSAEREQFDDFGRLVFAGDLEAATVVPKEIRGKTCPRCGLGSRPTEGGFLGAWSCESADCPMGRPPRGATLADLMKPRHG